MWKTAIATRLLSELAGIVRTCKSLFDPYRPELHYMRGPGPKWHAKHPTAAASALPTGPATPRRDGFFNELRPIVCAEPRRKVDELAARPPVIACGREEDDRVWVVSFRDYFRDRPAATKSKRGAWGVREFP